MSSPQIDVLHSIIESWKHFDVEAVLEHLSDDIEFIFAIGQKPANGKEEVRRMLTGLAGHQRDVRWRLVHTAQSGSVVFAEGIDDYYNAAGHHIQTPHVSVYEFEGDQIRRWRDYYDQTTLGKAEAGKPLPKWLGPLVREERESA